MKQKNNNLELVLQKNNNLIDNLQDLLILLDADGKILFLNKPMAKNLGDKKENLIGKNTLDYFPPKVADFRKKMADKVINTILAVFSAETAEDIKEMQAVLEKGIKVAYDILQEPLQEHGIDIGNTRELSSQEAEEVPAPATMLLV